MADDCLAISAIVGKTPVRSHRVTTRTKDNDHAMDEKLRGRRPSHLEVGTVYQLLWGPQLLFPTFARRLKVDLLS